MQQAFDLHGLAVEDTRQGEMGVLRMVWDTHLLRCADSASFGGCLVPALPAMLSRPFGPRARKGLRLRLALSLLCRGEGSRRRARAPPRRAACPCRPPRAKKNVIQMRETVRCSSAPLALYYL